MSFLTCWTLSCSPIIAWIFFWFVMLPLFSILHNSSVDVCLSVFGFQGTGCRSLCSDHFLWKRSSGDGEIRTHDPLLARQVLSQLSYTPTGATHRLLWWLSGKHSLILRNEVGWRRLELPTSRLSGVRSNRLSYKPLSFAQNVYYNIFGEKSRVF